LYCGKAQYFVHFRVVLGHFHCGIQGNALERAGYFGQLGGYRNSERPKLSHSAKRLQEVKKGRLACPSSSDAVRTLWLCVTLRSLGLKGVQNLIAK
jgi:hypothetical protein